MEIKSLLKLKHENVLYIFDQIYYSLKFGKINKVGSLTFVVIYLVLCKNILCTDNTIL